MYKLDTQAAMNADSTGKWLTETGKYVGRILCGEDIKSERTGTKGIALTLQANDGRETRQFIYTEKEDGTRLSGFDLVMALMWALLNEIAEQAMLDGKHYSAEAWHEWAKRQFIGVEELPGGGTVGISTTTLNVEEFGAYMTRLECWAAQNFGIEFRD